MRFHLAVASVVIGITLTITTKAIAEDDVSGCRARCESKFRGDARSGCESRCIAMDKLSAASDRGRQVLGSALDDGRLMLERTRDWVHGFLAPEIERPHVDEEGGSDSDSH